jgi:uncharacterized damage-inducible protein DinB
MISFYETYGEMFSDLLERMDGIFSDLPVEALDWTPDPGMNSMTVLVVHTLAALDYWVGHMLGGEPTTRDRSAEFEVHGYSKSKLHDLLNETRARVDQVLDKLTMADLDRKEYSPIHKDYFTGNFSLAHALSHTALHVGHMEITLELWEQFDWERKGLPK